jgi:hypothetical protein
MNSVGSEHGPVAGSYEHVNVLAGSIQGGDFSDQLSEYKLVKNASVLWRE